MTLKVKRWKYFSKYFADTNSAMANNGTQIAVKRLTYSSILWSEIRSGKKS